MSENTNATGSRECANIVHAAAPAVHGDRDAGVLEHIGEVKAGELAALVGIHDLRRIVASQHLLQSLDAKPRVRSPLSLGPMAFQWLTV